MWPPTGIRSGPCRSWRILTRTGSWSWEWEATGESLACPDFAWCFYTKHWEPRGEVDRWWQPLRQRVGWMDCDGVDHGPGWCRSRGQCQTGEGGLAVWGEDERQLRKHDLNSRRDIYLTCMSCYPSFSCLLLHKKDLVRQRFRRQWLPQPRYQPCHSQLWWMFQAWLSIPLVPLGQNFHLWSSKLKSSGYIFWLPFPLHLQWMVCLQISYLKVTSSLWFTSNLFCLFFQHTSGGQLYMSNIDQTYCITLSCHSCWMGVLVHYARLPDNIRNQWWPV